MSRIYKVSTLVRVDIEVEKLVRELGRQLGYSPATIRNMALLLGLHELARARAMSKARRLKLDNEEFWSLLSEVKRLLGEA